ncbi:MAG TPA: TonB-dependent receptor [Thermoanaerobaculaceae bacterium]|nr:TonB-dependent receptor [Thermoanaerobaculaceae bacterium]
MMRGFLKGTVFALLLLALAAPVAAQSITSGSIQGTVKDTKGAVLPGATVTASSDALVKGKLTTPSDEHGIYRFPSLPVGMYTIDVELAGFVKQRAENISVNLAKALVIDVTLPQAKVAEEVSVTGEAPLVSVASNTVSTSFDTKFLEQQPLPRNYYALLASAPGVTLDITVSSGSAMMAYGGTGSTQNSYTLDGVNVGAPGDGNYWLLPSIQWMQEVQVGGLGANAEYGGYTGGVINGVTKSGGNEFHGGVEAYITPESWVANNTPADLGPQAPFKFHDYAVSLGGAITKDQLWFFLSGEDWEQDTSPPGALTSTNRKTPRYLGKLTWQADTNNRLVLMAEHDTVNQDYRGVASDTLPEAAYKESAPNYTFAASWESLLNASNFLTMKLTGFGGREDDLPYHGYNTPGRQDTNTGINWQNLANYLLSYQRQATLDASWSVFKDGLFGAKDSHSFKFGGGYQDAALNYDSAPDGGYTLYDDSSDCPSFDYYMQHPECGLIDADSYKETGYDEYHEHLRMKEIDLYAQDSMRLDRWTINYGVRYGNLKGGFAPGTGNTNVYSTSFVDPRVGFVWDVFGDNRTALKAHWGRYHDKMKGYLYDREISGHIAPPVIDCYWDSATGQYDEDSNGDPGCETYSVPPAATMGHYGGQYVDETLLSVDQQLGKDMVVGLDLIDRRFRDIMAMINVNNDYTEKIATNNPLTGGTLPVYSLNSPQQYVLTTDDRAYRDYRSAMLRVEKRYSHGWYLQSSLVWTDLKGNEINNYGYEHPFEDLNGYTNADGRLDWVYNKWDYKLNAAVDLPLNLQLSGMYNYLSGMYWTPYVRVTSGLNYNSTSGRNILMLPRGTYQFPSRHLLSMRVAWNPKLAGALKLTVSGEVFNILNNNTMLDTYQRWGSYNAKKNTWSGPRSSYDTPYTIESPRQVRLGVRLEF